VVKPQVEEKPQTPEPQVKPEEKKMVEKTLVKKQEEFVVPKRKSNFQVISSVDAPVIKSAKSSTEQKPGLTRKKTWENDAPA